MKRCKPSADEPRRSKRLMLKKLKTNCDSEAKDISNITSTTNEDGNLSYLNDDVYRILLSYLDVEAKKNLKLASRTCERRVLSLDKSMRIWFIDVNHEFLYTYEDINSCYVYELYLDLIAAKKRHLQLGDYEKCELGIRFYISSSFLCKEHKLILKEFRNKITFIGCNVRLLDSPPFKIPFPQLSKISLFGGRPFFDVFVSIDKDRKSKENITNYLQLNAETLKFVNLAIIEFDFKIPENMCLKKLSGYSVTENVVADLLELSQRNLKSLILRNIYGSTSRLVRLIPNFKLPAFSWKTSGTKLFYPDETS